MPQSALNDAHLGIILLHRAMSKQNDKVAAHYLEMVNALNTQVRHGAQWKCFLPVKISLIALGTARFFLNLRFFERQKASKTRRN